MKPLICNLKMNHDLQEMIQYKKALEANTCSSLWLCPATCYLPLMYSRSYFLCAQDVSRISMEKNTGSVSISALKSLGIKGVLIGHFELMMSLDEKIEKALLVLKSHMKAFVILSDTKEEYDYQYTFDVLYKQIETILNVVSKEYYVNLIFIYEPSFLVGKKHALDESMVSNLFYQLKKTLERIYAYTFSFYYGGGLTETNVANFFLDKHVDGLLLGSLANDVENVLNILKIRQN